MKSAKIQKATMDPLKISGRCGRLMCCLRYEDKTYEEIIDLIYEEDESVIPWELVENHPAADLIQIMYNTKTHFEFVTKLTTEEK